MQRASQILSQISAVPKSKQAPILDREELACAAWARAVGKKIAQHSRAAKLVRGKLVVEVEDAAWQRNLFTLSRHILANLGRSLGPGLVDDIEFRILPPRREPQRAETTAAHSDEADAIADPGLRRVYRNARTRASA